MTQRQRLLKASAQLVRPTPPRLRRPRTLALELVEHFGCRIREGALQAGEKLPTEAEIMGEFGVSRTVVREALSKLQAAGQVETRHGIGTFVVGVGDATPFRIAPEQLATLQEVLVVLELRIAVETESAALAAQRRTAPQLQAMRAALDAYAAAVREGDDAIDADFQFHLEVARATQNPRFVELMVSLGWPSIPRARLDRTQAASPERVAFLLRVGGEHESVFDAIANRDPEAARAAMRTHLANSRERRRRASPPHDTGGAAAPLPAEAAISARAATPSARARER